MHWTGLLSPGTARAVKSTIIRSISCTYPRYSARLRAPCIGWSHSSPYSSTASEPDCPELPSTPSWSLSSLMEKRDALSTSADHSDHITPETIDHLLSLAHLYKPEDPHELERLIRDVRRMRNFLNYIRSTDDQHCGNAPIESLRSLVDDGEGLRLRSSSASEAVAGSTPEDEDLIKRRDMLLMRPKRVKGNFFVVGTELDPKDDN